MTLQQKFISLPQSKRILIILVAVFVPLFLLCSTCVIVTLASSSMSPKDNEIQIRDIQSGEEGVLGIEDYIAPTTTFIEQSVAPSISPTVSPTPSPSPSMSPSPSAKPTMTIKSTPLPTKMPVATAIPTKVYVAPTQSASCKYACVTTDVYNCSHFTSHAEAQTYFNCCNYSAMNDPNGLDGNNDGVACESR